MKYRFIVNPFAGKGKYVESLREKIKIECEDRGVDYDVCITESIEALGEYVKSEADKKEAYEEIGFFACGGDGTLCETMNAIMSLEDKRGIHLGLVPVGTGNDFVRNFGDKEIFMDIGAQLDGDSSFVDIIRCNDMHAINMVNIGFDCEVVCNTNGFKKGKLIPSKFAYIAGLVKTLVNKPGVSMKMSVDDGEFEKKDLLLTTFANGKFCGGGFHSNPHARLNDGKIDSMLIKDMTRTKFISLVSYYKKGTHVDNEKLSKIVTTGKFSTIKMLFDRETNICIDGEIMRADRISMSVINEAIEFIIPKGASKKGFFKTEAAQEATV